VTRDDAWRSAGTLVVLGASAQSAGTYQRAGKLAAVSAVAGELGYRRGPLTVTAEPVALS
jgi:hypothetical protein